MIWNNSLTYQVMSEFPETRGDDKKLLEEVWKKCGLHLTPEQRHIFYRSPSPESIRRTRQAIQERGLYVAAPEVQQARMELNEKVRKEI